MTTDYLETLLIRIEARRESALDDCEANLAALLWDAKEAIAKLKTTKTTPLVKLKDKNQYYESFQELWEHQQGALFLEKEDIYEFREQLCEFFYSSGFNTALASEKDK